MRASLIAKAASSELYLGILMALAETRMEMAKFCQKVMKSRPLMQMNLGRGRKGLRSL